MQKKIVNYHIARFLMRVIQMTNITLSVCCWLACCGLLLCRRLLLPLQAITGALGLPAACSHGKRAFQQSSRFPTTAHSLQFPPLSFSFLSRKWETFLEGSGKGQDMCGLASTSFRDNRSVYDNTFTCTSPV